MRALIDAISEFFFELFGKISFYISKIVVEELNNFLVVCILIDNENGIAFICFVNYGIIASEFFVDLFQDFLFFLFKKCVKTIVFHEVYISVLYRLQLDISYTIILKCVSGRQLSHLLMLACWSIFCVCNLNYTLDRY